MAELKPCPFCGASLIKIESGWEHPHTYDCILGAVDRDDQPLYIAPGDEEAWNRRAEDGK